MNLLRKWHMHIKADAYPLKGELAKHWADLFEEMYEMHHVYPLPGGVAETKKIVRNDWGGLRKQKSLK